MPVSQQSIKRTYSIESLFLPKHERCFSEYMGYKGVKKEQTAKTYDNFDSIWLDLLPFFEYYKIKIEVVVSRLSTYSLIVNFDRNYHHLTNKRDRYRLNYFATERKAKEKAIEKGIMFLELILQNKTLPFKKRLSKYGYE